ncbi:MAG: DUF1501 domain-containing protein [Fuerstiella sp.]|nr:DUF1501 domain-containing protein [Fuerstiella sp.]
MTGRTPCVVSSGLLRRYTVLGPVCQPRFSRPSVLSIDRPIVALLADLTLRGLLEDTLIIQGGECGRMSTSENGTGRDDRLTDVYGYVVRKIFA